MKIKKIPYSKIKEMVMKPITEKDIKLFSTIYPVLFNTSIVEQEKILEKKLNEK